MGFLPKKIRLGKYLPVIGHLFGTFAANIYCHSTTFFFGQMKEKFRAKGKIKCANARDEKGLVGEGTHERFIIDEQKFASKARERKSTA